MMEETTPRTSAKWVPHTTFAQEMGMTEKEGANVQVAVAEEKGKEGTEEV